VKIQGSRLTFLPRTFLAIVLLTLVWLSLGLARDFHVYWQAGASLRTAGWSAVYQISQFNAFKYHPIFAMFFAPFGLLTEHAAKIVWAVLNAVMLFDVMRRWRSHWQLNPVAIGMGYLCVGHALFWQYDLANVTFAMLWLWTVALTSPSQWRIAICYAVLIALKPFWLALLVPWILCRRFALMGRVAAMLGALSLAPIVLGVNGFLTAYQRWMSTFADPEQFRTYASHPNQSWYGLLYRNLDKLDGHLTLLWFVGSALVGLAWFWQWRTTVRRPLVVSDWWMMELSFAPFILWTAPLSWVHHQVLLWPLLAIAWQQGRTSKTARAVWIVCAIVLTLLSESIIGRPATLHVLTWGIPLVGFLLLNWWANADRLRIVVVPSTP
jgi:Glycosyltransferase family 87